MMGDSSIILLCGYSDICNGRETIKKIKKIKNIV